VNHWDQSTTNGYDSALLFPDINVLPNALQFGVKMRWLLDKYGDNHEQVLAYSAEIAHNLERLKVVAAYVRRQAMLDAHNDLGNGAEVGRLAGVGRVRAHELLNRAVDERMHNVDVTDVIHSDEDPALYA